MYHQYFGLTEPAFSIAVNPKYLFMSTQHKEALAHLVYGVQGGGFVLLSGEVGTGKTTIVRCLLEQMPGDTEIAFVLNPMADVTALLATICNELHIQLAPEEHTTKVMMDKLQAHLLGNHAGGKRTVLLIDEAQLLSADVLEQIRLLTNLETSTDKLLQIVLVGQPEVNDQLAQPRLRQLSQRITARFHLEALNLQETKQYIEHRLSVAGKKDSRVIFPNKIIKKIHRFSGGIPRLINILCERLLVGAYGHNKYEIDKHIFQRALSEVEATKQDTKKNQTHRYWAPLAVAACVLCGILVTASIINNRKETPGLDTSLNSSTHSTPSSSTLTHAPTNSDSRKYQLSGARAFTELFKYYNVNIDDHTHPCWQTELHLMSCSKTKFESWSEIEELNKPVILSLITPSKEQAFAALVGMNDTKAFVLTDSHRIIEVSKIELGQAWNGSLTYLWRKPNSFDKPLSLGMNSPVVAWAAEQFALIDKQAAPITGKRFSTRLQTRLKIFQASSGLDADGILGERTLIKLNEALGISIPLLNELPTD